MQELKANLKIIVIGESNVGKSSLLVRFLKGTFNPKEQTTTIGCDFYSKEMQIEGVNVNLALWDTAGQEKFQKLSPMYYRNVHGAILVYEITSPASLKKLDGWLYQLSCYSEEENIVKMVVGNKLDLDRKVSKEQGLSFAKKHNALFIETSALNSEGIDYAFTELVRKILKTPELWVPKPRETIKLSDDSVNDKSYCRSLFCNSS